MSLLYTPNVMNGSKFDETDKKRQRPEPGIEPGTSRTRSANHTDNQSDCVVLGGENVRNSYPLDHPGGFKKYICSRDMLIVHVIC